MTETLLVRISVVHFQVRTIPGVTEGESKQTKDRLFLKFHFCAKSKGGRHTDIQSKGGIHRYTQIHNRFSGWHRRTGRDIMVVGAGLLSRA